MRQQAKWLASSALGIIALIPTTAVAQQVDLEASPTRIEVDENGVDLGTGKMRIPSSSISIGDGDMGLIHSRFRVDNGWRHNYLMSIVIDPDDQSASVRLGGATRPFIHDSGAYYSAQRTGETLTVQSTTYTYTSADGTVIVFDKALVTNDEDYYGKSNAVATTITEPSGKVITLSYRQGNYVDGSVTRHVLRLASVNSNSGYQLKFEYAQNAAPSTANIDEWFEIAKVAGYNNAVVYCSPTADTCAPSGTWPTLAYDVAPDTGGGYIETVTDAASQQWKYKIDAARRLTGIQRPSESTFGTVITYDANSRVSAVQQQGTYTRSYESNLVAGELVIVSSDSLGRARRTIFNEALGGLRSSTLLHNQSTTADDESEQWGFDEHGRVSIYSDPESLTQYTYDVRGNMTSMLTTPKGAGSNGWYATYPSTCTNQKICNKPLTSYPVGTPSGQSSDYETTYSWDASHGGLVSVTRPAAEGTGPRATTTYSYAGKSARYLTGTSSYSTGTAITRLTQVSTCRTAATCDGTANELETNYTYPSSSTPNNVEIVTIETRAGNGSTGLSYTYDFDDAGRLTTIDGPLSGAADASQLRYDAVGRVVMEVGRDPDGSSSAPRVATKYTYNADSQPTAIEIGNVDSFTDTSFTAVLKTTLAYDSFGRLTRRAQVATSGTTQYSLLQYSYDAAGRLECTALRMDAPTTASTQPSSACTPKSPAGSYGADRITKNIYDRADRVVEMRSGVGTALEQSASISYRKDGTINWLEDAKGNRTQYTYASGRLYSIAYPSKTATHTPDYANLEVFTYDAFGNLAGFQNREGKTFTFAYDRLQRMTTKVVPERSGLDANHTRDVYYAYDLLGSLTSARFNSQSGPGITFAYDALGRVISETNAMNSPNRAISYGYDSAGNRSSITYPDGAVFGYEYHSNGAIKGVTRSSSTLVTFYYDDLGRLNSKSRHTFGPDQTYGYDAAGRLTEMNLYSATPVEWDFTYNPAGELLTNARSADGFASGAHTNGTTAYTSNGLNQYTQAGANSATYDANGNLTSIAGRTFVYDVENHLVSATGGGANGTLMYDPLGRLYETDDTSLGGTTNRLIYSGQDMVLEYSTGGSIRARFVHGVDPGDDPLLAYSGSSTSHGDLNFLYADRLGSIVYQTDSSDSSSSREIYAYDDFGLPSGSSDGIGANGEGRYAFTGQMWVPEVGLYHYKARAYAPGLGRFMQPDPIGYDDGMNLYQYVQNDPVNFIDPSGETLRWACMGIGDPATASMECGWVDDGAGPNWVTAFPGLSIDFDFGDDGDPNPCSSDPGSILGIIRSGLEGVATASDVATVGAVAGVITAPAATVTKAVGWVAEGGLVAVNSYDWAVNGNWGPLAAQGAGAATRLVPGGRAFQAALKTARGPTGRLRSSNGRFRSSHLNNPAIEQFGKSALENGASTMV